MSMATAMVGELVQRSRACGAVEELHANLRSRSYEWFKVLVDYKEKMGGTLAESLAAVPPYRAAAGGATASGGRAVVAARMKVKKVINDVLAAIARSSQESRAHPTAAAAVTLALLQRLPFPLREQVRQLLRIGTMGEVPPNTICTELADAILKHVTTIFNNPDAKDKEAFNESVVLPGTDAGLAHAHAGTGAGAGGASASAPKRDRCGYCKAGGHAEADCFKKKAALVAKAAADGAAATLASSSPAGGAGKPGPSTAAPAAGAGRAGGPGGDKRVKVCYNCDATGHLKPECPNDCKFGLACNRVNLTGAQQCKLRHAAVTARLCTRWTRDAARLVHACDNARERHHPVPQRRMRMLPLAEEEVQRPAVAAAVELVDAGADDPRGNDLLVAAIDVDTRRLMQAEVPVEPLEGVPVEAHGGEESGQ
jgi:hypothetical protein